MALQNGYVSMKIIVQWQLVQWSGSLFAAGVKWLANREMSRGLVIHGHLVRVGHITTTFLLLLLYLGQWVERHFAIAGRLQC